VAACGVRIRARIAALYNPLLSISSNMEAVGRSTSPSRPPAHTHAANDARQCRKSFRVLPCSYGART